MYLYKTVQTPVSETKNKHFHLCHHPSSHLFCATHPSRLLQTVPLQVCAPASGTHGGSPTHPATRASAELWTDMASPASSTSHLNHLEGRDETESMEPSLVINDSVPWQAAHTWVMLDELLQRVKRYLCCDVEAPIVHVADSVVLDSFTAVVVQVPDW